MSLLLLRSGWYPRYPIFAILVVLLAPVCKATTLPLSRECRLLFAALADNSTNLPVIRSLEDLRRRYLNLPPVATHRQNVTYRRMFAIEDVNTTLVVNILFPIVQRLNRILGSKEYTASIFNLYKYILEQLYRSDPLLQSKIRYLRENLDLRYADYKLLALAFNDDSPELQQRLALLQRTAAEKFLRITSQIPEITSLNNSGGNIVQNRLAWFHWGTGSTGLEAWVSARTIRFATPAQGHVPIQYFRMGNVQRIIEQRLEDTEAVRRRVINQLMRYQTKRAKEMLAPLSDGHDRVPSGLIEHILPWVRQMMSNPESAAQILPAGYRFSGLFSNFSSFRLTPELSFP